MNLLSDLSSEMTMEIFVEKKYSEEFDSVKALFLIKRINEILEPISNERDESVPLVQKESNH